MSLDAVRLHPSQSFRSHSALVGTTADLRQRLANHNAGQPHRQVWSLGGQNYLAFEDEQQARTFERYLKSASGRAFAKKRLLVQY